MKKLFQFNKKTTITFWTFLFLLVVFLNIYYLQPIDWLSFPLTTFTKQSNNNLVGFILTLSFGIIYFIINDLFLAKLVYSYKLKGKKATTTSSITTYEWFKFQSISFYIRSITPFSIGSEPYIIWWLTRQGLTLKKSSIIVSSITISWLISQGAVTLFTIIYLQIQNKGIFGNLNNNYGWIILTGLLINWVSILFLFSISYSGKIHFMLSLIKHKLYLLIGRPVTDSISDLKIKYLLNESFKKDFSKIIFSVKTIKNITIFVIQNILNYSLFAWIAIFIFSSKTGFWDNFHLVNLAYSSNNFFPTPGSEGSIQFTIEKINSILSSSSNNTHNNNGNGTNSIKEIIFLWRWFQKYQFLIISTIFLVLNFASNVLPAKRKQNQENSTNVLFPFINTHYL